MGNIFNSIIEPISWLLGQILDIMYKGISAIGITNIAITIILFTLLVKLLMLPLTIKQSKMTKLNSVIAPEVKAIQDKYKSKKGDTAAMQKMQAETKAVYEKYGTSQMGGCIQLLIQFPIIIALYSVIQKIPMYVSELKVLFVNILQGTTGSNGIMSVNNYADIMKENFNDKINWSNVNDAVNAMNSFTSEQWDKLRDLFPAFVDSINTNQSTITKMNTFLGVNVSQVPVLGFNITILIPILAGLSQYISMKISQGQTQTDSDNPAAASMKMMTYFMPLVSVFIAFSVPSGLGLYWIATAVFQTIIQLIVNKQFDKMGTEEIIKKNVEKRNKKLIKKGIDPNQISKNATVNTKRYDAIEKNQQRIKSLQERKAENDRKIQQIKGNTGAKKTVKSGSLADRANMVSRYNETNKKNN